MKLNEIYINPPRYEYPESYQWHFDKIDHEEILRTGLILKAVFNSDLAHIGVFDKDIMISYVGLHLTDHNLWQVDMQCTDVAYRSQGYIRRSIEYAVKKYGCVISDQGYTLEAQRTWTALIKYPNLYHYYYYNTLSKEKIPIKYVNDKVEPDPWNQDENIVIMVCNRTLSSESIKSIALREQWEIKMGRRDRWIGPDFTDFNP